MVARSETMTEMTVDEQHQALERLLSLRRKPVVVEVPGNTIGSGFPALIQTAEGGIARNLAGDGERKRYVTFLRRWGPKFRGSIIGRSRTAWQMHVCRLPVFATETESNGRRIVSRHLRRTRDAMIVVRWFRRLTADERWELCASSRAGRTAMQKSSGKSYHRDK